MQSSLKMEVAKWPHFSLIRVQIRTSKVIITVDACIASC